MAVLIEILSRGTDSVGFALYYPIPVEDREDGAAEPSRVAAGKALSAQEITDLRSGALHEIVASVSIRGYTRAQVASRLEGIWSNNQAEALNDYKNQYSDIGLFWDGTGWN